jgi:hypothetical protein
VVEWLMEERPCGGDSTGLRFMLIPSCKAAYASPDGLK